MATKRKNTSTKKKKTPAPKIEKKAKGFSLHIGVNKVSTRHYAGWAGELRAPEADAKSMEKVADLCGFEKIKTLATTNAKREAVIKCLLDYAKEAEAGDLVFISYSGHGGQVKDLNDDEPDFVDETWCLYDGQLIDDEIFWCLSHFKAGVRILGIIDCCHSGSAFKAIDDGIVKDPYPQRKKKVVPMENLVKTWVKNADFYKEIGRQPKLKNANTKIKASVIQISACQDIEVAYDGNKNSLFTEYLLKTWRKGKFVGGYPELRQAVNEAIPLGTPNYFVLGEKDDSFTNGSPFVI